MIYKTGYVVLNLFLFILYLLQILEMDNKLICRTCLRKEIPQHCKSISPENENEETSNILEMLSYCIPELDIYLVVNPVMCNKCIHLLEATFKFKTECLKNEERFLKFSHSVNPKVDLNYFCSIYSYNQNESTVNTEESEDIEVIKIERDTSKQCNVKNVRTSTKKVNNTSINQSHLDCEKCYGCENKLKDPSYHSKIYTSPFICYNCGKEITYIADFRKHMTKHTRQRKCKVCNKCFRDLYQLTTHLRTHTGSKPFTCNICSKSFRQKHNLSQHLKQHAGCNKCNRCNKVFSTKYNLKVHMQNSHLKKQTCELCGEKFYTKTALIKHLETDSPTCGKFIKIETTTESVQEQQIKTEMDFIADDNFQCKEEHKDGEVDILN